ncbi:unnamed protein product [Amoebophrya sp. A25]|nr:unnamed protein product [Amoebophrya sp. A25]|eukprot:GSA25T00018848001.1
MSYRKDDAASEGSAERAREAEAEDAEIERMAQSQALEDRLVQEPIIAFGGVLEHDYWLLYEFGGIVIRLVQMWFTGYEAGNRFEKFPGQPYSSFHDDRTAWGVHVSFLTFAIIDHGMRSWCVGFWTHLRDAINSMEFGVTLSSFFYLCIFLTTSMYKGSAALWHLFGVLPMLRPWIRGTNFVVLYHRRMLQEGKSTIFTSLVLMTRGIGDSVKTLLWVFVVVFICCYVMGILMVLQVGQNDEKFNDYYIQAGWDHEEYFANVPAAVFTMFQVVTKDKWSEEVVRHIAELQPWAYIIVPLFMGISTYGFCSMIIGIIVNSILQLQDENSSLQAKKDAKAKKILIKLLKDAFARLDEDGSGTLSLDEIQQAVAHPELRARLESLNFPVDSPEDFFNMVDTDNSGDIDSDEFITACTRLRGSCKSRDMLEAEQQVGKLGRYLLGVEDRILEAGERIKKLDKICNGVVAQADMLMAEIQKKHRSGDMLEKPSIFDQNSASLAAAMKPRDLPRSELKGAFVTPGEAAARAAPGTAAFQQQQQKRQQLLNMSSFHNLDEAE